MRVALVEDVVTTGGSILKALDAVQERIGPFEVSAIGLGCINLSHAYGVPPDAATGARLLNAALDMGYTHLDTAALYGFGANETLLGNTLRARRDEYMLASKCGIFRNAQGTREIDGRPQTILQTCDDSLRRLQTDVIDLYCLHRWDKRVPIEESVGALAGLVVAARSEPSVCRKSRRAPSAKRTRFIRLHGHPE